MSLVSECADSSQGIDRSESIWRRGMDVLRLEATSQPVYIYID
ncbi:MAG: hypothetical protein QF689_11160 [Candidatus Latescibacteria bacterium]|jgi:hypothetical protein|nr:hypothetical protein [Candidatus Latescibacterota bacterium]